MNRRHFLASVGSLLAYQTLRSQSLLAQAATSFSRNPFTLGVASGDPFHDSVLLWTRLAPEPQQANGGVDGNVQVKWVIATDPDLRHVVRHGEATATPDLGHSLHVVAPKLKPGHDYWYQFTAGGQNSPVGHTRTAPPPGHLQARTRFAFASCQHYEYGYYTAYKAMAQDDLDAVLFLGDYIYESHEKHPVRRHWIDEPRTLPEYRVHHAQYKTDPDLMACHAAHPWIVTFDDHEVQNNWAGTHPQWKSEPEPDFLARRAAAFQAYYENMPLRAESLPSDGKIQVYRTVPYGALIQFTVVDTRQFRTRQPCGDDFKPSCTDRMIPDATMMGPEQESWFANVMQRSRARWNVVANQVMISQLRMPDERPGTTEFNMDQWDGYPAARQRLMDALARTRPQNPVFVTGDVHQTWVGNLQHNVEDRNSPVLAAELVGTSIASGGDGLPQNAHAAQDLAANPNLLYNNAKRGYFHSEITPDAMHSELRTVDFISREGGSVTRAAGFTTKSGTPGVEREA